MESAEENKGCCDNLKHRRKSLHINDEDTPCTDITPEMEKASNQGLSMIKGIIFPSLPAVLQDAWVYLELLVSIAAFAFGMVDIFSIDSNNFAFKSSFFALATISIILAISDGFLYFFQRGSCARGVRACRRWMNEAGKHGGEADLESEGNHENDGHTKRECCKLGKN